MDLIKAYYVERGYDSEFRKIYQSKHRKIVSWQKKFKMKTSVSATRKLSKMKLRSSKSSLTREKVPSVVELELQDDYSKIFSDAILCFSSKCEDISSWRHQISQQLQKSAGPIEKFDHFENNIRSSVYKSYSKYFPDSTDILEDVLNLMFQKADNSFTETIKVNTRHIRVVPEATAKYMNVKSSLWDRIHHLVQKDFEVCKRYQAMPKAAFGKTFQNNFKNETNTNDFKTRWRNYLQHQDHHRELESFAAVWKNITHLQSTRKFCIWLANNPNVLPPPFLENEGLLRENLSFDYSATSESIYDEYVAPEEIIERPFPSSKSEIIEKSSIGNSADNEASLSSVDISDINIIV